VSGADSSVLVDGTGTKWSSLASDQLLIGGAGPGKVVVTHDGTLASDNDINVGDTAAGTLRVESGGQVHAPNCSILKGSVQVRGQSAAARSTLKLDSELSIGEVDGSGSVVIEAGGQVTASRAIVGDDQGNGGETLTISGLDNAGNPSLLEVSG